MDIRSYYDQTFRGDVARLMGDANVPYFGHTWRHDCQGLDRIASGNRGGFLLCLYFTVLVDQAMHCHFRHLYPKFETLTRYPKFCHGLGQFQFNPRSIITAPVERGLVSPEALTPLLDDAMLLFVDEVIVFLRDHMTELPPRDFFRALAFDPDVQIPELLALLDGQMAESTEYLAYKALRRAVDSRVPDATRKPD